MACHDVRVALATTRDFPPLMYDVALGGWINTRSDIRTVLEDDDKVVATNNEPNIVSCTEFRNFWVSWEYNLIRCGKGLLVGHLTFLDYNDSMSPAYEINYIGISTGFGATGTWKFGDGKYILIYQQQVSWHKFSIIHDIHIYNNNSHFL